MAIPASRDADDPPVTWSAWSENILLRAESTVCPVRDASAVSSSCVVRYA